jgi:murein DD-endopeptidase MepM/ murein hydrolase activator NlpD
LFYNHLVTSTVLEILRRTKIQNRLIEKNTQSSKPSISKFKGGIKKNLINRLSQKKVYLMLVPTFSLIVFIGIPLLGYSKVAHSDEQQLFSPETYLYNSQTIALLNSRATIDPKGNTGGADPITSEDGALLADISPITDVHPNVIDNSGPKEISVYTVREEDTLSQIADMFGVSSNTIRWANDIDIKGTIRVGQDLLILPISGLKHTVTKGETLASIAKKTGGDLREISLFNGIEEDASLELGSQIIIPDGEVAEATPSPVSTKSISQSSSSNTKSASGYYSKPVKGIKTQGSHDTYHAIDVGAPEGTPVWAMADGVVLAAKSPSGWNGGYGGLIIIQHNNGTQTLYAHLSKVRISTGQTVKKGQTIGDVGHTGRVSGPTGNHLHFEIRPGKSGINTYAIATKMY